MTVTESRADVQEALTDVLAPLDITVRSTPPDTVRASTAWIELAGLSREESASTAITWGRMRVTWRVTVTARPSTSVHHMALDLDAIAQALTGLRCRWISEPMSLAEPATGAQIPAIQATIYHTITTG